MSDKPTPKKPKQKVDKEWLGDRVIQTIIGAIIMLTISIILTVVWGPDEYVRWVIIIIAMFIFVSFIALYYKKKG